MGSKKRVSKVKKPKAEHHDIYFETEDPRTFGLWGKVEKIVRASQGEFESPSNFVREAVLYLIKKRFDGKGEIKAAEKKMKSSFSNVHVSKVGKRYFVKVENLKDDERIEVGAGFYKRNAKGKVIKVYRKSRVEVSRDSDSVKFKEL